MNNNNYIVNMWKWWKFGGAKLVIPYCFFWHKHSFDNTKTVDNLAGQERKLWARMKISEFNEFKHAPEGCSESSLPRINGRICREGVLNLWCMEPWGVLNREKN